MNTLEPTPLNFKPEKKSGKMCFDYFIYVSQIRKPALARRRAIVTHIHTRFLCSTKVNLRLSRWVFWPKPELQQKELNEVSSPV